MTVTMTLPNHSRGDRSILNEAFRRVLGVPLVMKLIGANAVIVAAAIAVQMTAFGSGHQAELLGLLSGLAAASLVSIFLVRLALKPIAALEALGRRVQEADFDVRAVASPFADTELLRLGKSINVLLDSLAAERRRIQALGAEVIYAQDAERARVARELHDSIAQTLAGARLQLSAAAREATPDIRNRIIAAGSLVGSAIEEVKRVSYSLHPRVAEDLGLETALAALGQQIHERSGIRVFTKFSVENQPLPGSVSATLFRIAQEALRNIEMHSKAKYATVEVVKKDGIVRIEVADDGCGFDADAVHEPDQRTAMRSIRDRVALAGGSVKVESVLNGGTRVIAELAEQRAS